MLIARDVARQCIGALLLVASLSAASAVGAHVVRERIARGASAFECVADARSVEMRITAATRGCFGGTERALDVSWSDDGAVLIVPYEKDATTSMPRELARDAVVRILHHAKTAEGGSSTLQQSLTVRLSCDGVSHAETTMESSAFDPRGRTGMQRAIDGVHALRKQAMQAPLASTALPKEDEQPAHR